MGDLSPNGRLRREAENIKIPEDISEEDGEPCRKTASVRICSASWSKAPTQRSRLFSDHPRRTRYERFGKTDRWTKSDHRMAQLRGSPESRRQFTTQPGVSPLRLARSICSCRLPPTARRVDRDLLATRSLRRNKPVGPKSY
jgi:hypothetical protein